MTVSPIKPAECPFRHKCMRLITTDMVFDEVSKIIIG
jgi:hypothetical protein